MTLLEIPLAERNKSRLKRTVSGRRRHNPQTQQWRYKTCTGYCRRAILLCPVSPQQTPGRHERYWVPTSVSHWTNRNSHRPATRPRCNIPQQWHNLSIQWHDPGSPFRCWIHNESKARSRAGAHIFLSENYPTPKWNGPILTISQIIKFVMSSAAESELGALYITAKEMVLIRQTLIEMGWKQPP